MIVEYAGMVFLVTPSNCDGDCGTRDLENKQTELCRVLEKRILPNLAKETSCMLCNSKVHCVYNTQHVGTMLSQMNPSHTLQPSLRYSSVVYSHLQQNLLTNLFPPGSTIKTMYAFLFALTWATCVISEHLWYGDPNMWEKTLHFTIFSSMFLLLSRHISNSSWNNFH